MNPLIHLNYRIWTLWTPSWYWDNWSPESCAEKIALFTLPVTLKRIIYRWCYLAGMGKIPYYTINDWTLDLWCGIDEWLNKQTS